MRLLILGTSSGAGKTTVCAMLCRYFSRRGADVFPFKGSNLSCDAFWTSDGGRIGIGQRFQAMACGREPSSDMNPVLLEPAGDGGLRVYVDGRLHQIRDRDHPMDLEHVMGHMAAALDRCGRNHELVLCEGSGSPAELNLMESDIANIGVMRHARVPAVLVGDIERGGVFAALYGTWKLIPDDLKPLMRGFIINRFRGDASILEPGIEKVEELTGMRCLGVLPYLHLRFPAEDSLSADEGAPIPDPKTTYMENLDRMIVEAEAHGFDFGLLEEIARSSPRCHAQGSDLVFV